MREESKRIPEGAHDGVLLSFVFQVSHEIGSFIMIADENLKSQRTV